jgi:ABC-type nitrate/sulfonate/bicarbonate transport system permease component
MSDNDRGRLRVLGKGARSVGFILNTVGPMLVIGMWVVISWRGWVPQRFLPAPWRVLEAAGDLEPNIGVHAFYTAALVVTGLLVGVISALGIGFLLRHSFVFRSMVTPIIESWRPVPPVALVPFFIVWFGFMWSGKLLLVSFGTFLVLVVAVIEAIDRLNPVHLRTTLSFGGSNRHFLRYAALPGIVPGLIGPLRIALAVAITLAVVSEFMGATRGIGHVINVATSTFATHTILLCAITLGIMGGFLDWALRSAHRRFVHWSSTVEEAVEQRKGADQ